MKANGEQEKIFIELLSLMWSGEALLVNKMPSLVAMASNEGLKLSLANHLAETKQHKNTLEFIAKQLKYEFGEIQNPELSKIINEGDEKLVNEPISFAKDLILIEGAIQIERYETAGYKRAAEIALNLGLMEVAAKLSSIKAEEVASKTKLNFLSKNISNLHSSVGIKQL